MDEFFTTEIFKLKITVITVKFILQMYKYVLGPHVFKLLFCYVVMHSLPVTCILLYALCLWNR